MNIRRFLLVALVLFGIGGIIPAHAQTTPSSAPSSAVIDELQQKINQRNSDIQALEKEIAQYQSQLNEISSQANSLSATIKSLDLTKKKLEANIAVTENKIAAKNLEIQGLSSDITHKGETIEDNRRIITHSLTTVRELNNRSIPELLLGSGSLSGAWNTLDELAILQKDLTDHIHQLETVRADLEIDKKASEKARAELIELNDQLKDQKKVVLATTAEKNDLLKDTKQSEAQYQRILAAKQAQRAAFEQEVLDYESQLKLAVDPAKIPASQAGILHWPLDAVTVTQYFGNTSFSTANPQIYNGHGHTGIDLRASIGTPIKAALSGVVSGVGNTDLVRGCYSYGKWVMIKHPNGLSSLYGHLSVQSVTVGQTVATGQILGYSGNTGYTTGPHLHFGVYATEGVQIAPFNTSINCKGAIIPLADFKAYLNPLSYLPAL